MKTTTLIAVLLAAAVVGLGQAAAANRGSTTVSIAGSRLGRILVDSRGHTLYLFERDARGHSACTGACAAYWPPLLTRARPTAGRDAKTSLIGVIRRGDGTKQVTYAGYPLYRFAQDTRPGSITGQDLHFFGGGWYVLSPVGTKIET